MEQVLGAEHPSTLSCIANLGIALRGQGKHAEAEQLQRQALQLKEQVLGAEHPSTLKSMDNLGKHSVARAGTQRPSSCTGRHCSSGSRCSAQSTRPRLTV